MYALLGTIWSPNAVIVRVPPAALTQGPMPLLLSTSLIAGVVSG